MGTRAGTLAQNSYYIITIIVGLTAFQRAQVCPNRTNDSGDTALDTRRRLSFILGLRPCTYDGITMVPLFHSNACTRPIASL